MKDLFEDVPNDPREEWVGMPEFVQEKKEPYKVLNIRFETEEDYQHFASLIGQKLTEKTKSIWHPYKPHKREVQKQWQ